MLRHRALSRWLLAVSALVLAACLGVPGGRDVRTIRIVSVSDWHGQLEPVMVSVDRVRRPVGGAAALKTWLDLERAQAPGATIVTMGGDSFGGTPPASAYLDDVPVVEIQNALGVDVDTLGNHNFDHGLERLRTLVRRARFPYLSANVVGPDGDFLVAPTRMVVLDGVRVGVIGITNPETPQLVKPGATGDYRFLDPVETMNAHAATLRRARADLVIVVAHIGAVAVTADGRPLGPLGDMAAAARGIDVLIGDHTNVSVATSVGDTLVVESRSRGLEYAVVEIQYDIARRAVVGKRARHRRPFADSPPPDAAVQARVDGYRERVRAVFDRKIGDVPTVIPRVDGIDSPLGRIVADAMRTAYGTDVAFVNAGALRDDLPSSYRPTDRSLRRPASPSSGGPPWDVVIGDLHSILPFGNVAVTFRASGKTLWDALEHSVATGTVVDGWLRQSDGRFLFVSGFRYTIARRGPSPDGIVSVVLDDGRPLARDGTQYSAVTVDFLYDGGDAYAMLKNNTGVTRLPLTDTLREFLPALARRADDGPPRIELRDR